MQVKPTTKNQALTSNTETAYDLPANTTNFIVKLKEQNIKFRIAWVEGETATSYVTIGANGVYDKTIKPRNAVFTIYIRPEGSNANAEIESWRN